MAWPDAGESPNPTLDMVARTTLDGGQPIDDGQPVRRVLDDPGPAPDDTDVGGAAEELGEPAAEVPKQRRRGPRPGAAGAAPSSHSCGPPP